MRILSVAEINVRAGYRYRIGSPSPPRDPMMAQHLAIDAADEEVAAIMGCISPINVAPLVMFAEYGSPQPLYPELVPAVDDNDNGDEEKIEEKWQAREAEEAVAHIMARQAEARAVEEEEEEAVRVRREAEEEEAARLRLIREAEEEEAEEPEEDEVTDEEEEAAEEEDNDEAFANDSGVDSVDSNAEPMDAETSSSNSSSSSDSEAEDLYDPTRDPEREARLHRILGVRKNFWRVKQSLLRLQRRHDLNRMKNKIRRVRERRTRYMAGLTRAERRNLPVPQVERPRRNRDFCYGCGRFYLVQRVRWWWRCEECGFWLCPDCNTDPLHCRRNEMI